MNGRWQRRGASFASVGAIEALARRVERWGWLFSRREEARRRSCGIGQGRRRAVASALCNGISGLPVERDAGVAQSGGATAAAGIAAGASTNVMARGVPAQRFPRKPASCLAEQSELHALAAVNQKSLQAAWWAIEATWLGARPIACWETGHWPAARLGTESVAGKPWSASFATSPGCRHPSAPTPRNISMRCNMRWRSAAASNWREVCDREPDSFKLAA